MAVTSTRRLLKPWSAVGQRLQQQQRNASGKGKHMQTCPSWYDLERKVNHQQMISQSEPHASATHTPLREVHMLPPLLDATGVRYSCINVILSRISNMRITSANLDVISKTFWGKKCPLQNGVDCNESSKTPYSSSGGKTTYVILEASHVSMTQTRVCKNYE